MIQTPKALSGASYLVGDSLSRADVHLLECSLMLEEKFPEILSKFPNIKVNMFCLFFLNDNTSCTEQQQIDNPQRNTHLTLKCFVEGFPGQDESAS